MVSGALNLKELKMADKKMMTGKAGPENDGPDRGVGKCSTCREMTDPIT